MNMIFFYGLFMDGALLEQKGLHPRHIGSAGLSDYKIVIGTRATLVPSVGSVAYGIVMELSADETEALYAEPSVSDYRPEAVRVQLVDDLEMIEAACYNLPHDYAMSGSDKQYAERLSRLVLELGLPAAYADEISRYEEES